MLKFLISSFIAVSFIDSFSISPSFASGASPFSLAVSIGDFSCSLSSRISSFAGTSVFSSADSATSAVSDVSFSPSAMIFSISLFATSNSSFIWSICSSKDSSFVPVSAISCFSSPGGADSFVSISDIILSRLSVKSIKSISMDSISGTTSSAFSSFSSIVSSGVFSSISSAAI